MAPKIEKRGSNQRYGHGKSKACQVHLQQTGTRSKCTGKSHEQTGAANEIEMERKKAANDGYEQDPASHASKYGSDAHHERDHKE